MKTTRMLAAAVLLVACGEGTTSDPERGIVSSVEITFGADAIPVGEATTLKATAYDAARRVVDDQQATWTSETPSVAIIEDNRVIGVAPGTATIAARIGVTTERRKLTVSNVDDVAIMDARVTQGVQDVDGSIPMLLDALPAVVNVLFRPRMRPTPPTDVVLRVFDQRGALKYADTSTVAGAIDDDGYLAPTAQFHIPAQHLEFGLRWQIVRDPRGLVPDDSSGNDTFPRTGTRPLPTLELPALAVHFVPVKLTSEGGVVGAISPTLIDSYLQDVRRMLPVGKIDVTVGEPLSISQTYGVKPKGGDNVFWGRVLTQLDAARMASMHRSKYWIGLVPRPTGYTEHEFAGYAYRPSASRGDLSGTRTSAVISFDVPGQQATRMLIAHELGHNFGRSHAPCGNVIGVDYSFPTSGGFIEQVGHDVYSWHAGLLPFVRSVPTTTGDLMGYCPVRWASVYTYRGVMEFRRQTSLVADVSAELRSENALVVSGTVSRDAIVVFPAEDRSTIIESSSRNDGVLELLDRSGRVVYTGHIELRATGDDGSFTFMHAIARDASQGAAGVRVRIGARTATLSM